MGIDTLTFSDFSGGMNKAQPPHTIADNEVSGSDWGIQIGSSPDSANVVQGNRVHGNRRAAIAVWGQHNRLDANDATGNGLGNLAPSCSADMMDWGALDNDWSGNSGTFAVVFVSPRGCN